MGWGKSISKRILIVSGEEKVRTLNAALRGGLYSIPVADDHLVNARIAVCTGNNNYGKPTLFAVFLHRRKARAGLSAVSPTNSGGVFLRKRIF